MSDEPRSILIIKPSALGDIIQALPVLTALRRNLPQAEIRWLIRTEYAPLIDNHPHLTDTILFDRKFLGRAWKDLKALKAVVSLILRLRRHNFDLVIDLQGLFRTAVLAWLSGCKQRVGMACAREFGHIFYTKKIKQDENCIHLVDYYLKMIASIGLRTGEPEFIIPSNDEAAQQVSQLLANYNVGNSPYAILVPGSAHKDKCWPVENFAVIADRIAERFKFSVISTGSSAERELVEDINHRSNVPVINLAGRTNIPVLVELLRSAKIVISNDTGPGHIAAALGVPVVMIFGRSNPARVAPYGRWNCVAAIEPDKRGFRPDSADPRHDIKAVTIEQVWQKICCQLGQIQ